MKSERDLVSIGAVIALIVMWGSAFALIKIALGGLSPFVLAFGRVTTAAIVMVLVALVSGAGLPKGWREWQWVSLIGLFSMALPFSLISWGQQTVPSGVTAIMMACVPLLILLLSRVVLQISVSFRKWTGFVIGLVGLLLLAGPSMLAQVGAAGQLPGQIAIFGATLSYACGAMVIKKMPPISSIKATAGAAIFASIALTIPALLHLPPTMPGKGPILSTLLLGVFATGLAQSLRHLIIRRQSPVYLAPVGYLIPIWAGFLGITFMEESIGKIEFGAYALIVAGLLVSRDRNSKAAN